ncbi:MAG: hypothetical protein ACP5NZ_01745 [Nanobdellota archaeon]
MKNSKFFKFLSEVLSLKSKKLTWLFGMLFPFFPAHIYAYSCVIENVLCAKKLSDKILAWTGYFFLLLMGIFIYIAFYGLTFLTGGLKDVDKSLSIPLGLMGIVFMNLFVCYCYYGIFLEEKEKITSTN